MDTTTQLIATLIVTALGAAFKTFRFVHEGERGIKLRFGRALRDRNGAPKIIEPGFVLLIPFVDSLKRHHVRQQTINLASQTIMIQDGFTFTLSAVVILKIKDIYKALFEIAEIDNSIADLCMGILRDKVQLLKYTELLDTAKISAALLLELKEKAAEWGIEFLAFKLTDCAPTPETSQAISIMAAARMRAEALKEAGKSMGLEPNAMNPNLAAALIGIPLTVAIGDNQNTHATGHNQRHAPPVKEGKRFKMTLGQEEEPAPE
jgi:regulator of protease activity HflC (stomatin/prohibitin superfamily)